MRIDQKPNQNRINAGHVYHHSLLHANYTAQKEEMKYFKDRLNNGPYIKYWTS